MCGIIGVFGTEDNNKLIRQGIELLKNRGRDNQNIINKNKFSIGHTLHAVVNKVIQPLEGKGILTSNCEIYNWQELNKKYNLKTNNDSETLLKLIDEKGIKIIDELDGVYAFGYLIDKKLILARDILGVKPLWFHHSDEFFVFASEKKAIEAMGFADIIELNPRKILFYDLENNQIEFKEREFFKLEKTNDGKLLETKLINAVKKRIPDVKTGILFSGGIDSSILALILKKLNVKFEAYVAGFNAEAEDVIYAKKVSEFLGIKLNVVLIKNVEDYLKKIVPLIEDSNVVKAGVALPFFVASEKANKDKIKVIFSGLGSEEIFAGYQRHKNSNDLNKECLSGLLKMYERDLYRDDVITMANSIELRLPFLDRELVDYSLNIQPKLKLNEKQNKIILRELAKKLGLKEEFAERKKRAAQYGGGFDKTIEKLAKKEKKTKSEYLRKFYPQHNLKLGILYSGGKDSNYALFRMQKQNYEISCLISLVSNNPDSYMFHTPNIELTKMQAEAIGIQLIEQKTAGEKEKELDDLKKAIERAKKEYNIKGIVTGALFSNYQRERIEKICDKLSLKIFSPLWHKPQNELLNELIENNFEFIITKIAAEGLDKKWLGKLITKKDVAELINLSKKYGINPAGEGGEFETFVLDAPFFKKKIVIKKFKITEENKHLADMFINELELVNKNG